MNNNILREYDIRGLYPNDINENVSKLIGHKFGSFLRGLKYNEVIVGYDVRLSSESLKTAIIEGLLKSGIDVIDIGKVSTPMVGFATIYYHTAGIMVTASHNPKDENGFKLFLKDNYALSGKNIKEFYRYVKTDYNENGKGNYRAENIFDNYKQALFNNLSFGDRKLNIVVDPGSGSAALNVKNIFNDLPFNITYICDTPDGNFPFHHPDPNVEDNLKMLKEKVLEIKADFGVAYDGDADRIGLIDNNGKFLTADYIMIIFWHYLANKIENKTLYDVKCSMALKEELDKLGVKSICYKTGAPNVKNKINELNIPFGGEYSGHLVFKDKYFGIDDGIYASLRLFEIFSNNNKSISDELKDVNNYLSTGEIKIKTTDDKKFVVVEKVKEYCNKMEYNFLNIDGVRIENEKYMISFRASNTGPNLTFKVEAIDKDILNNKKEEFLNIININL